MKNSLDGSSGGGSALVIPELKAEQGPENPSWTERIEREKQLPDDGDPERLPTDQGDEDEEVTEQIEHEKTSGVS